MRCLSNNTFCDESCEQRIQSADGNTAEFDFRHNARIALGVDDEMRSSKALLGVKGKRLTYRTTSGEGVE